MSHIESQSQQSPYFDTFSDNNKKKRIDGVMDGSKLRYVIVLKKFLMVTRIFC